MSVINAKNGITVKDIHPEDFIKAFAAYLKKSGKFKIPEVRHSFSWSDYLSSGPHTSRLLASMNSLPMTQTGSTLEQPHVPDKFT
jgi:hypothetical protein